MAFPFRASDRRRHRAGEGARHWPPEPPLPDDPAERFAARVSQMMKTCNRDRTWCRAQVAAQFPDEAAAARARG